MDASSQRVALATALAAILWAGPAAADPPPAPPKDQPGAAASSAPSAPPPASAAPALVSGADAAPLTHYEDSVTPTIDDGSLQRKLAVFMGSVGFAGVVVGSVFGILAVSRWNKVKASTSECRDPATLSGCPVQLQTDQKAASSYATVSTYSLMAGSLFVGGAIAMWYLAPHRPKPAARIEIIPSIGPGGAGGVLSGVF